MPEITWTSLSDPFIIAGQNDQPAEIIEPWRVLAQIVRDCTYVRFVVEEGEWQIPDQTKFCGADGYAGVAMSGKAIIEDCALGALIGRFNGGSAGYAKSIATDADKGAPFPVGTYCIMPVPAKCVGPIFIGFNIVDRPIKVRKLKIRIEGATPTL
jgi:hypothetical protein